MYAVTIQYLTEGSAKRILLYQSRKKYREDRALQKLIDESRVSVVNEQAEVDEIVNVTGKEVSLLNFSPDISDLKKEEPTA